MKRPLAIWLKPKMYNEYIMLTLTYVQETWKLYWKQTQKPTQINGKSTVNIQWQRPTWIWECGYTVIRLNDKTAGERDK